MQVSGQPVRTACDMITADDPESARPRRRNRLGGALSAAVAGFIVVKAGYSTAFLFLAAVAATGLGLFAALMPETAPRTASLHAGKDAATRVVSRL